MDDTITKLLRGVARGDLARNRIQMGFVERVAVLSSQEGVVWSSVGRRLLVMGVSNHVGSD